MSNETLNFLEKLKFSKHSQTLNGSIWKRCCKCLANIENSPSSKNLPIALNQVRHVNMLTHITAILVYINMQLNSRRVVRSNKRLQDLIGITICARRRQTQAPIDGWITREKVIRLKTISLSVSSNIACFSFKSTHETKQKTESAHLHH